MKKIKFTKDEHSTLQTVVEIEWDNAYDFYNDEPDDPFYKIRLALVESILTKVKKSKTIEFTDDEHDFLNDVIFEATTFEDDFDPDELFVDLEDLLKKFK